MAYATPDSLIWLPWFFFHKASDHKEKFTSSKKPHRSGGVNDLWYLEWQKQEKHIELFPIHL